MSLQLFDRTKELTNTTGTGTLTLVSAPTGFRRFSSVLSDGDITYYTIESGNSWEVGIGFYSANTLSRTTVLASSNSNALINITASRSFVFITYPADKALYKDGSERAVMGSGGIIFSDASVQTTAATSPDLSPYAPLASPTFTGVPAAPTAAGGTNTTQIATTAFVTSAVGAIDLSPYLTIAAAASTYAALAGSYLDPAWITGLAWSKISGTPTTLLGYGITDSITSSVAAATYVPYTGATGAVDLGTNALTVGAITASGDLKFTDATYDIGKSGATRPRDGFFSRNLRVESTITTANVTANGVAGDLNLSPTSTGSTASIAMCQNGFVYQRFMPTMGFIQGSGQFIGWDSSSWSTGTSPDLALYRDAAGILHQRNSTNAQTFRLAETYTSATSFGAFQLKANAGAAYQIGSAKGSAGGSNQALSFGHWDAAGTFASNLAVNTESGHVNVGQTSFRYNAVFNTSVYGVVLRTSNPFMTLWAGDAQTVFGSSFSGYGVVAIGPDISANSGYGLTTYDKLIFYTSGTEGLPTVCIGNVGSLSGTDRTLATTTTPSSGEFTVTAGQGTNKVGGNLWLVGGRSTGNASGGSVYIGVSPRGASGTTRNARFTVAEFSTTGAVLTQPVSTSGSPTAFTITGAAHTTLTASTEATDVNVNLARTVQFATGAISTQRAMRIQAPTYSFVGASTITTASTLSISGAPVAGTNATITNAYALNVESGRSRLGGNLFVDGGTSTFGGGLVIGPFTGFGVSTDYIRAETSWSVEPHLLGYPWHFAWVDNVPKVTMQTIGGSHSGVRIASDCAISIVSTTNSKTGTPDVNLWRDAANVLAQRNSTNAQTFRVYGTHTSSTAYELINIKGKSTANFEIGPENGSAGGTLRGLTLGGYTAGSGTITPWLTFDNTGAATFASTTTFNNTMVAESANLYIRTGNLWFDSYGTHGGMRSRRANGTLGSPTQVVTNDIAGFWASMGYHNGGAFHTGWGSAIVMYATENYTATAQGTKLTLWTTPNGSTTQTLALTIDQNQVATFSKLVAQSSAETTSTPSGTTQTITLNNGNHQTLTLTSSTGDVTVTLTVPSNVSSGTLIIKQHGTTPRDITWAVSSGTFMWMGTEPTWASDAANAVRIVSWRWDGSVMYLAATDVGA